MNSKILKIFWGYAQHAKSFIFNYFKNSTFLLIFTRLLKKLQPISLFQVIGNILPFLFYTKQPQSDISLIDFEKIENLYTVEFERIWRAPKNFFRVLQNISRVLQVPISGTIQFSFQWKSYLIVQKFLRLSGSDIRKLQILQQTWKKLQAVQAVQVALADIFLEILLF